MYLGFVRTYHYAYIYLSSFKKCIVSAQFEEGGLVGHRTYL